jgi:hypothetical protein
MMASVIENDSQYIFIIEGKHISVAKETICPNILLHLKLDHIDNISFIADTS